MRNLKRALSLGLTAAMISGLMVMGSSAASYADVTSENNVEAIEVLESVGIMIGDENGNFNPDQNVTRNEMAVVMANLMEYNVASYKDTSPFTDVPSWAEPYVAACWTNGITAGTSATTYGGSENVTTAQAALMLLKALGYFQYSSDFGSDWQLATVSQGNKIDLFDDVDSGVREAMTRNDLAQLVLNTLESGTVEAEKTGQDISVGDITITSGVTYKYVTSGKDYAYAINDKLATYTDGTHSTGAIVELGEKLYQGDLTKDEDQDDFGRPANIWEYQAKEIGTFAKTADYTYTSKVTSKALYNEVGKTATDNYDWTVSFNGDPVKYDGENLSANKTDDDKDFVQKALGGDARTGNGVVTEVYVDGTDKTVDVAIIEYYAAEVYEVNEDDATITLSDFGYGPADNNDEYDTTDFEEDQIVMYSYANGEIQDVYAAEQMSGEVTRVRSNTTGGYEADGDNFVVDGTTYKYNKTMDSADRLGTENVNNNVVAYLDANGYVAYIDESAMTYDYAYVLSMGTSDDQYGGGVAGETVYARLVLTDGTLVKVETDVKSTDRNDYVNHIVSYSADKNDVYSLTVRDKDNQSGTPGSSNYDKGTMRGTDGLQAGTTEKGLKIENGVASFWANNNRYTANSNTVFIVADSDDKLDDYDFTVYTGIKNVPDIDFAKNAGVDVAATEDSVAKVVYVEDADVSGAGNVIFARADKNAKLVKDSETGNYYEINAVVNGEAVTLDVKENSTAADRLVNSIGTYGLDIGSGRRIIALDSVTENADGLVTTVSRYEKLSGGDGFTTGTGTGKAENETVLLTNERFAWDDEVVVVRYNYKGDFEVSRINSIKTDSNDQYVAVMDSNVIAGICIIEKDGGENSETTPGTVLDTILVTENDGKLTVHYYGDKPALEDALATIESWLEDQGMTLKDTTISGGKYTFTCTSSRGYTYEYTWDRSTDFKVDLVVITVDGNAVQYLVKGSKLTSEIDIADYAKEGTTYKMVTDGKTYFNDYSTPLNTTTERNNDYVITTGYIKVTGATATGAEGSTYVKAGTVELTGLSANTSYQITIGKDVEYATADASGKLTVEAYDDISVKAGMSKEALENFVADAAETAGVADKTLSDTSNAYTMDVDLKNGTISIVIENGQKVSGSGLQKLAIALLKAENSVTVKGKTTVNVTLDGDGLSKDSLSALNGLLPAGSTTEEIAVVVTNSSDESVNYTITIQQK